MGRLLTSSFYSSILHLELAKLWEGLPAPCVTWWLSQKYTKLREPRCWSSPRSFGNLGFSHTCSTQMLISFVTAEVTLRPQAVWGALLLQNLQLLGDPPPWWQGAPDASCDGVERSGLDFGDPLPLPAPSMDILSRCLSFSSPTLAFWVRRAPSHVCCSVSSRSSGFAATLVGGGPAFGPGRG
jgi:hypothetical protein